MGERLLQGVGVEPMTLESHLRVHGPLPAATPEVLASEIERAGLRGRGGGGFPLARKLAAVKRARGRPTVIVNGCEGEPLSAKDGLLLGLLAHLVIDGALCLARVIGSSEILIAVDELNIRAGEAALQALEQRPKLDDGRISAQVVWTPTGYVGGQETAIVRWCEDGIAKPRFGAPRVTERGIGRRPTLVANAETVAHVALIARHGGRWFRQAGTDADPGTALITVGGRPAGDLRDRARTRAERAADVGGRLQRAAARVPARRLRRRLGRCRRCRRGQALARRARAVAGTARSRDRVRAAGQRLPGRRGHAGGCLARGRERGAVRAVRERTGGDRG